MSETPGFTGLVTRETLLEISSHGEEKEGQGLLAPMARAGGCLDSRRLPPRVDADNRFEPKWH